ncbi:MAG: thiamine pyrophosphate-dependent enzyme [Terriglobales bacterium]
MKRIDAIRSIIHVLDGALVVHATGMISRESYTVEDRPENFYMIGSMGLNSAIALGVALNAPRRLVVILDGDGSVLMNMGTLASIAELKPANLIHVVLDNESYASTGGQPTISGKISLERVAAAAGYAYAGRAENEASLAGELACLTARPRPAFLLVKVDPGNHPDLPRVRHTPPEIRERFARAIAGAVPASPKSRS